MPVPKVSVLERVDCIADFAAARYVHRNLEGSDKLLGWVGSEVGHCAGHRFTMNKVSLLIGRK